MKQNTLQTSALFDQLRLTGRPSQEFDIAEWNLILAEGLPGSEGLDLDRVCNTIDDWANSVRLETERQYYRFMDHPGDYNYSQGYFCVLVLVTFLERDLGVRYNPERVKDESFQDPYCIEPDFSDSQDLFIHGIVEGAGGTCASMPVLYTAIARRLGYPVYLVEAPGHLFSRWDDPLGKFNGVPDRFNIDACGHGLACFPDQHYETWPRPWTKREVENGWYLNSLSAQSEIACFIANRGCCLEDHGRIDEAFICFDWAYQLTRDERYFHKAGALQHRIETSRQFLLDSIREIDEIQRERRDRNETHRRVSPIISRAAVRVSPINARDVGHGGSCQCPACAGKRPEVLAAQDGDFGHGPSCQCLHCRENRATANSASRQFKRSF